MKFKLTKAEYEALSPEMKLLYVADGDGFKLPLVDYDDPAELKRAKDREVQTAKDAKAALAVAQAELDALKTDPARKAGDIATLEKSWKEKLDAANAAHTEANGKLKATLEKTLIEHAAAQVAGAITDKPANASLMLPHITSRFEVVYDGDVPSVKIKDETGRISAMNFEEFQKELVAAPKFSSIVVASKAGGAGSGTGKNGGGSGASGDKKFAEMNGAERTALYNSNRAEFDRLAALEKQAASERKFGPVKPFRVA